MSILDTFQLNGRSKQQKAGSAPDGVNIVGEGMTVRGNVEAKGNIRIGGILDGKVRTKGKVVVGSDGIVEGAVSAGSADIAGRVEGDVAANDLLVIRSTGIIKGNIRTGKLIIEDGAVFTGECLMYGNDAGDDQSESVTGYTT